MTSLPIQLPEGFVTLIKEGETVTSGYILAKKDAPQDEMVNIMQGLNLSRRDAKKAIKKGPGERIAPGDVIAIKKTFFGKVKGRIISQISGTILRYERDTGNLFVRTDFTQSSLELISPVAGIISLCNNKDLIEVLNKETDDYIKSKEKYDIDILDQNY